MQSDLQMKWGSQNHTSFDRFGVQPGWGRAGTLCENQKANIGYRGSCMEHSSLEVHSIDPECRVCKRKHQWLPSKSLLNKGCSAIGHLRRRNIQMDKLEERPHWMGTNFLLGTLSMQSCPIDFDTDQLSTALVQWNQATRTNCRVDTENTETCQQSHCIDRQDTQNRRWLQHHCNDRQGKVGTYPVFGLG